jgi:predicted permease
MEALIADLRYAVRRLLSNPGFTLVAALIMALGIGANSAIFSVVNAVLLRPLPVESPGELVEIYTQEEEDDFPITQSYPDYLDIRARDDLFSGVAAYTLSFFGLSHGARSEAVFGEAVSGDYFQVLGVQAARGRVFIPGEDDAPGAPPVAVVSHALWRRRFGADPGAIGQTIALGGRSFEIVGVLRPQFKGLLVGFASEIWVPLTSSPESDRLETRGSRWLQVKGRLRRGVGLEEVRAGLHVLARQLAEAYPETNEDRAFVVIPTSDVRLHPEIDRAMMPAAALLMVVVALVLLIACTNLANLLLARGLARRKEVAIRLAMGAKRLRLVRQLLTESMLLALLGGALGLLVAYWTAGFLVSFRPPLPFSITLDLGVDGRVLGFTLLITVLTGLAFGLVPALQATKPQLVPALKDEVAGLRLRGRRLNLRNSLVVVQIAVSLVLLIGAGLFMRSLVKAQEIDPGFERERVAILGVSAELNNYTREQGEEFLRNLMERTRSLPGVESVALANRLPLGYSIQITEIYPEGSEFLPDEAPETDFTTVSPGYFETLGVPLLRGRDFSEQDHAEAPRVVIVSEAAARRFWPGQDAVGQRLRLHSADGSVRTVIGVARDTKVRTLGEAPRPYVYEPFQQTYDSWMFLLVRTSGDPRAILAGLRHEVMALDETMPIMELKTMGEHLSIMLFPPRMGGILLAVFGALGVLLATVGLYGVVAYGVSRRTHEVGIRIALGARRTDVVYLVLRQALAVVVVGTGIGLALAFVATQPLAGLLYGTSASDPLTFAGVTLLLAAVAVAASLVPALRAARVDPAIALRYE